MSSTKDKRLPNLPNMTEKYEIPIAARLKGPGPAAYTLPSRTTGDRAAKRAPAYSFGIKLFTRASDQSPGPNTFFPQTTRTGPPNGPSYSLQGGYKKEKADLDTPGPGKYNPAYFSPHEPRAPAYSIGGRRSNDSHACAIPGPSQYAISSTLGMHPNITMKTAAAYTIRNLQTKRVETFSPGPAAYSALDPSKIKSSSPAYSLGRRWQNRGEGTPFSGGAELEGFRPGPGHYSPSIRASKSATPSFSFRCKHSEYELFIPDVSEGIEI